jgi:hypothetical protein
VSAAIVSAWASTPFADADSFALRGLGFGIAGTYVDVSGDPTNSLLSTYRTPGQQVFFRYRGNTTGLPAGATYADGERLRFTPQFYYSYGQFGLLGEYAEVRQDVTRRTASGVRSDSLDNSAWQLAAHWFLTGEEESFRGFKPGSVFDWDKGTWGAFELVGRYQELRVSDDAFAGGADECGGAEDVGAEHLVLADVVLAAVPVAVEHRRQRSPDLGLRWKKHVSRYGRSGAVVEGELLEAVLAAVFAQQRRAHRPRGPRRQVPQQTLERGPDLGPTGVPRLTSGGNPKFRSQRRARQPGVGRGNRGRGRRRRIQRCLGHEAEAREGQDERRQNSMVTVRVRRHGHESVAGFSEGATYRSGWPNGCQCRGIR